MTGPPGWIAIFFVPLTTLNFFFKALCKCDAIQIVKESILLFDMYSDILYAIEVQGLKDTIADEVVGFLALATLVADFLAFCCYFNPITNRQEYRLDAAQAARQHAVQVEDEERYRRDVLQNSGWESWWERGWGEGHAAAAQRRDRELQTVVATAQVQRGQARQEAAQARQVLAELPTTREQAWLVGEDVPQFILTFICEFHRGDDGWSIFTVLQFGSTALGFAMKLAQITGLLPVANDAAGAAVGGAEIIGQSRT